MIISPQTGWALLGWFPYDMPDTFGAPQDAALNAMSRDVCRAFLAALLGHMDSHADTENGTILRERRLPHTFSNLIYFLSAHQGQHSQTIDANGRFLILSKRETKHLAAQEEEHEGARGIGLYVLREAPLL